MKKMTVKKFNAFTFFKLPSAYWSGIRLKEIDNEMARSSVKYKWFNTNPFKSMYFATQSMAAEFSTGALVSKKTMEHKDNFAMLVMNHEGSFTKKATGRINFFCKDGALVDEAINKSIETGEPQTITMQSIGMDSEGDKVSEYTFTWSIKRRSKK